jgi:hypothetical protein
MSGVAGNSPGWDWNWTVRSSVPRLAVVKSSRPSPFRSATATEDRKDPGVSTTMSGLVGNWPSLVCKNTTTSIVTELAKIRSSRPSPLKSATSTSTGCRVVRAPPSVRGSSGNSRRTVW